MARARGLLDTLCAGLIFVVAACMLWRNAMSFVPASLLEPLGVSRVGLTTSAAVQGTLVGLLVALLFSLVPLLQVRRVKPLLLLRSDTASTARRRDVRSAAATAVVVAALVAVAMWQAGSWRTGLYVSAGLALVGTALLLAGRLLVRGVRPLTRSPTAASCRKWSAGVASSCFNPSFKRFVSGSAESTAARTTWPIFTTSLGCSMRLSFVNSEI